MHPLRFARPDVPHGPILDQDVRLILTFLLSIVAVSVAAQRIEMREELKEELSAKAIWATLWSTEMCNRFLDAMVVATAAMLVHSSRD